jgi:hypothetical protein
MLRGFFDMSRAFTAGYPRSAADYVDAAGTRSDRHDPLPAVSAVELVSGESRMTPATGAPADDSGAFVFRGARRLTDGGENGAPYPESNTESGLPRAQA